MVFEIIRSGRSLASDYGVLNNAQCNLMRSFFLIQSLVYVQVASIEKFGVIKEQMANMKTLTRAKSVSVLPTSEAVPAGCAMKTVSGDCAVYLLVKGVIDVDSEIAKLAAKLDKVKLGRDALLKKTQAPGYEEKVRPDVREFNSKKV